MADNTDDTANAALQAVFALVDALAAKGFLEKGDIHAITAAAQGGVRSLRDGGLREHLRNLQAQAIGKLPG